MTTERPVFSWLKSLPDIRKEFADDVNRGVLLLRQALRVHPLQGFELELLGRLLRDVRVEAVTALPTCRVAVLASYTSEPIANAVRVAFLSDGYIAEIYESPFRAYRQEIISIDSGLYAFRPDVVVIAISTEEAENLPCASEHEEAIEAALDRATKSWRGLWDILASRLGKPVLQHLCEIPEEEFLGISERRAGWTAGRFTEDLNARLIEAAPSFVTWMDVDRLAARVGRQNWRDWRMYHHGKFGFSPRFLPDYSRLLATALRSALGKTKKALILDLDNTLWGGVIGDDGIDGILLGPDTAEGEAYQSFCQYVKRLGQRGVILGVCSKNEYAIAAAVFQNHPHMPLKLDDFAVVCCNWEDKVSNVSRIAQELNIDISSIVFADDNPAECELIRQHLPEVFTVQLDGDPALFVRTLDQQHLFDSQAFSREDINRAASYRARAQSLELQTKAPDLDAYLASLEMRVQVKVAGPVELPRLAQMEMKTNQFNLATRRLSLEQLQSMAKSPEVLVLAIFLADLFADHGLVSYVAVEVVNDKLIITDWLMSCRVFSRTLEQFTLNHLVNLAVERKVQIIEARFVSTSKNKVMETLFGRLGFSRAGEFPIGPWQLIITPEWKPLPSFITQ
jgi:FkbH-like protein